MCPNRSLSYLTVTSSDIAITIGVIRKYMQSPEKPHLEVAKRILKYAYYTLVLGLLYKRDIKFVLHGFTGLISIETWMIGDLLPIMSFIVAQWLFLEVFYYQGGVQGFFSCRSRICLVEAIG